MGAGTYERNGEWRGWRNGYKPRTLKTRVGELKLMVPKDCDGEFQRELFERYQRSEKAMVLAMLEMYVRGVLTHKVSANTEALCGPAVPKSQVSALTAKLDAEIAAWRMRALTLSYPYLVVDARYERVRQGGAMVSQGVLLVCCIDERGYREVLGGGVKIRGQLRRGVRGTEAAGTARGSLRGLGRSRRHGEGDVSNCSDCNLSIRAGLCNGGAKCSGP